LGSSSDCIVVIPDDCHLGRNMLHR